MTKTELLHLIQTDVDVRSAVSELLKDSIVGMMETDTALRAAVVAVVKDDISFELSCSDYYDFDYSGYRIELALDGYTVTSDSFTIRSS
jgi:hypothetical protein